MGALVALTGVAAYLGRQTAPEIDSLDGPSPEAMEEAEAALVELGIPVTTEN